MKISYNNAIMAVVLMYISLWLLGIIILSGFIIVIESYDIALKNEKWFIMIISFAWVIYCFCNGYLKWLSVKNYYQYNNKQN